MFFLFATLHSFQLVAQERFFIQSGLKESQQWAEFTGKIGKVFGKQASQQKAILNVKSGLINAEKKVGKGKILLSHLPPHFVNGLAKKRQAGEKIKVEGWLLPISQSQNPSTWERKSYWNYQGVDLALEARKFTFLGTSFFWKCRNFLENLSIPLQERITKGIDSSFPASLISAMVLGERSMLSDNDLEVFYQSGTLYFFVVSGFHVAFLSLLGSYLLSFTRLSILTRSFILLFFLFIYVAICGFLPSAIRAFLMVSFLLFAFTFRRKASILNSLSLSFLLCLLLNTRFLFSVSFQLSYIAVFGIALLFTILSSSDLSLLQFSSNPLVPSLLITKKHQLWLRFLNYFPSAFAVSFAAFLGISPLIAWHFSVFTPIVLIASVLLAPFVWLSVSLAFLSLLVSFLFLPLSERINQFNGFIANGMQKTAFLLSKIPFAYWELSRLRIRKDIRIYSFNYGNHCLFFNIGKGTLLDIGSTYNFKRFLLPSLRYYSSPFSQVIFSRFKRKENSALREFINQKKLKKVFVPLSEKSLRKPAFIKLKNWLNEKETSFLPLQQGQIFSLNEKAHLQVLATAKKSNEASQDLSTAVFRFSYKDWKILISPHLESLMWQFLLSHLELKSDIWILPSKDIESPFFQKVYSKVKPKLIILSGEMKNSLPKNLEKSKVLFLSQKGAIDLEILNQEMKIFSALSKKEIMKISR